MDALKLIRQAEEAGLSLMADGDQLIVRGPKCAEPIVRQIAQCKPDVLAALRPEWVASAHNLIACCPDENLRSDLFDLFEETAAFLEHMQGHSRARAEMLAFGHLIFHMLRMGIDVPVQASDRRDSGT